jgi:uncharacterized protein (TIGR02266 family)
MTYSGAQSARTARENLGRALAALQEDPNIPPDVMNIAQNIAQAVGALFDAERASSEQDGKASVKAALGMVGQTLALLQDVRGQHRGIQLATQGIAQSMSLLYPLTTAPSMRPAAGAGTAPMMGAPAPSPTGFSPTAGGGQGPLAYAPPPAVAPAPPAYAQPAPAYAQPAPGYAQPAPGYAQPAPGYAQPAPGYAQPAPGYGQPAPGHAHPGAAQPASTPAYVQPAGPSVQPSAAAPAPSLSPAARHAAYRDASKPTENVEVNIGANTESNFYVGFSGEIAEGGVFAATYSILARGTPVRTLITLPGGFETHVSGFVRFVRDPMDMGMDSEPGMGIQFDRLDAEQRELILRFVRKRRPIFYDD